MRVLIQAVWHSCEAQPTKLAQVLLRVKAITRRSRAASAADDRLTLLTTAERRTLSGTTSRFGPSGCTGGRFPCIWNSPGRFKKDGNPSPPLRSYFYSEKGPLRRSRGPSGHVLPEVVRDGRQAT